MEDATYLGPVYSSTFVHGVDEKRRVQVPARWRPVREGVELTLIVWPQSQHGPCLRVLPPQQMAEMMAQIAAMPNTDPKKSVLKRFIGSESVQVTLDKAGRICLPANMAAAAGIEEEAVFVGMLDRFEIWSPERHKQVKEADAAMAPEAFKLME